MRTFAQLAVVVSLTAALLVGCGGSQPLIGAPGAMPQAQTLKARTDATSYKVLYSFAGGNDGANPVASLIYVSGTLYGTTAKGGTPSSRLTFPYYCVANSAGCGTVFSVTLSGSEKVLHRFSAGRDGANPYASLIDVGGTLYGTTFAGGGIYCYFAGSCGTVFSVTPSGREKVLYSFAVVNGADPAAGLIDVKGTLYGTTFFGGERGCYTTYGSICGTVFSVTTAGVEKVLHRFHTTRDGGMPYAGLIDIKGKLYGTTQHDGRENGHGTVFSVTLGGREKVLHSFAGYGTDGAAPEASLIEVKGTFYSTTSFGGKDGACRGGCGTVFSITPGGTEKVLHSFSSGSDGARPWASLIELKGKLYGTTVYGGSGRCRYGSYYFGCGTVFSITASGKEKVLHSFGGGSDGSHPYAALIDVNGTLYGTTAAGGAHNYGTVFSLKP